MKIVVCGPPHSGKSVFLGGLCENLPRDKRYLFRACPDGEGTWTYKGNGAEQYRRKGKFSADVVDWYCQSLARCEMAPIVLVDIGGIPSGENRRILNEGGVSHAIILAGDLGKVAEWQQFLDSCGVEVVAILYSDYHGAEDCVTSDPMVVHHLERGDEFVSSRPAIQVVAEKILKLSLETSMASYFELSFAPLTISAVAQVCGINKNERGQYSWAGSDLPKLTELLHNRSAEMPEVVRIDGAAPGFLAVALAHECHPREVELNSPDGYVRVGCRKPEGIGTGIEFRVSDGPDGYTVVEGVLNPSVPLKPEQLLQIAPPILPMGSKVILSGRIPNWLMASLAMAYHGAVKAVATFQPGVGATVAMTHSAEVNLGELVKV